MGETERRREIQQAYNEKHGITPKTVLRGVADIVGDSEAAAKIKDDANKYTPSGQIKRKYLEAAEGEQTPYRRGGLVV